MTKLEDLSSTYRRYVARLGRLRSTDRAMQLAVGGEFDSIGVIEREILIQYGLEPHHYVIDVGCGSGRLAKPLAEYLHGPYLGIDIVPELVEYAKTLVARPEWRFEVASGLLIPEADSRADFVCFYSVFTHLLHEQSYVYLRDAHRVLRPGGHVVFSFLEFARPAHWVVFEGTVRDIGGSAPLNMFLGRDAIAAWAEHLSFDVVAIHDGDKPHVPLPHPLTLEDGTVMTGMGNLGQSVCVLRQRGVS
jgi:SAM-dependent methyltransferase